MKRWGELPKEKRDVWVEKTSIPLGREIVITGFRVRVSRYGDISDKEYIAVDYEVDGEKHFFNTGSMLLRKQLESSKDEMPFLATIKKKDTWLTLS